MRPQSLRRILWAVGFGVASRLAAEDLFGPCAELLTVQTDAPAAARCFNDTATRTGQYSAALARVDDLLARAPDEPWLHLALANLVRNRRDPRTEFHYRRAIELFEAHGERAAILLPALNLAQILERMGRLTEAEHWLERAEDVVAASEDPAALGRVKLGRARHALRQGQDLTQAVLWARQAVDEAVAAGPSAAQLELNSRSLLATINYELGRYAEVRLGLEKALALALSHQNLAQEAQLRYKLAVHHLVTADPGPTAREEALTLLLAAREAAERVSHSELIAHIDHELGKLQAGPAGDRRLAACVELSTQIGAISLLAYCEARQAVRELAADPGAAQALLARAVARAAGTGDLWAEVNLWPERLRLAWALEPYSTAVEQSWSVLAAIEALRAQQSDGEGRAELMAIWTDAYDAFAGYLLERPGAPARADLELAFAVSEQRRARVLREDLQAALASNLSPPDLAVVEASLSADEAILAYQLAQDEDIYGDFVGGSWVWAITSEGSRVYRLKSRAELEPAVQMLIQLADPEQVPASLTRLYQELLAPALADLPPTVERLILVPDGLLNGLPFAALRPSETAPPVASRYQLSSVPALTLWLSWRQQPASAHPAGALIFADPTWKSSAGVADWRAGELETLLGPLPHARQEGRSIRRLLRGSELWLGQEATEARLKARDLDPFAILHFAAHAVVDLGDPGNSALFLTPGAGLVGTSEEDGRVELAEVQELALRGQVVVLSACDSARGRIVRGEGVMGLARAFFRAGARVVVASLKPLADDRAARFFTVFYRHLRTGQSVDVALALAQQERIKAGAAAAEWTSLVVLGDGRLVPFPGGETSGSAGWPIPIWLVAALVTLLLLSLGWAFRRTRGRGRAGTTPTA